MVENGGLANESAADDLDPAAPPDITEAPGSDDAERTNYGVDGRGDIPEDDAGEESVEGLGHPAVLAIDIAKAHDFLKACMTSHPRVHYGLGAKAKPGAVPGKDFTAIDCSGFVREAIRRSTNLGSKFPDGSVVQHDWVKKRGFASVGVSTGSAKDGTVRIAFLSPSDSPSKIGHVVLLHQGMTLESHGGTGPDERAWTGKGWQAKAHVYVLNPASELT